MAVNPFLVLPGRRLLIARRTFSSAITLYEKSANFMASGTESPGALRSVFTRQYSFVVSHPSAQKCYLGEGEIGDGM